MSAKWLLWISLYAGLGIFLPWIITRAWANQHNSNLRPRVRQVFQYGELGLVSLMLAISVFAAIADAIHSLQPGKPVELDAPATPEAILKAIGPIDIVAALASHTA